MSIRKLFPVILFAVVSWLIFTVLLCLTPYWIGCIEGMKTNGAYCFFLGSSDALASIFFPCSAIFAYLWAKKRGAKYPFIVFLCYFVYAMLHCALLLLLEERSAGREWSLFPAYALIYGAEMAFGYLIARLFPSSFPSLQSSPKAVMIPLVGLGSALVVWGLAFGGFFLLSFFMGQSQSGIPFISPLCGMLFSMHALESFSLSLFLLLVLLPCLLALALQRFKHVQYPLFIGASFGLALAYLALFVYDSSQGGTAANWINGESLGALLAIVCCLIVVPLLIDFLYARKPRAKRDASSAS